jgi:hypothetical protein
MQRLALLLTAGGIGPAGRRPGLEKLDVLIRADSRRKRAELGRPQGGAVVVGLVWGLGRHVVIFVLPAS